MKNRETFIFWGAVAMSLVSLLLVLGVGGFQLYVRWFLNQSFTALGGGELEVLTAAAFALAAELAYLYRK